MLASLIFSFPSLLGPSLSVMARLPPRAVCHSAASAKPCTLALAVRPPSASIRSSIGRLANNTTMRSSIGRLSKSIFVAVSARLARRRPKMQQLFSVEHEGGQVSDKTNLHVGPSSTVRLDKFVYDPNKGTGSVVIDATRGAFRFSTGAQNKGDYKVKTPYGVLGVRG